MTNKLLASPPPAMPKRRLSGPGRPGGVAVAMLNRVAGVRRLVGRDR